MIKIWKNFHLYLFYWYICEIVLIGTDGQPQCRSYQAKCQNGECINSEGRCDGKIDCSDASDETIELCSGLECPKFAFACAYGACVNGNAKCNGIKDCADNSDEICDSQPTTATLTGTCSKYQYQCNSGECIEKYEVCDGKKNCPDSSDETLEICLRLDCPSFTFKCRYGACVNGHAKCNGVEECIDGSDESSVLCGANYTSSTMRPSSTTSRPTEPPTRPPFVEQTTTQRIDKVDKGTSCWAKSEDPNMHLVHDFDQNVRVKDNELIDQYTSIHYKCTPQYVLFGDAKNTCFNGEWIYEVPQCSKVCPPDVIKGVTFTTKCVLNGTETSCEHNIRPGTRATITCAMGYREPSRQTYNVLVCDKTGEWDYHPASCEPECGTLTIAVKPFVSGGEPTNITTVPWHTAIYKNKNGIIDHICGGNIISSQLVISAAHCFWDAKFERCEDAGIFRVGVGKIYRSYNAYEALSTQFFNISEIHVPIAYHGASGSYENDIAILVLNNHIKYKEHIKPICIHWQSYLRRDVMAGITGRIAGWGLTSSDNEVGEDLKAVDLPVIDHRQCQEKYPAHKNFITGEKFCVGAVDKSVCQGDSGGGFVFKDEKTEVFFLLGIVSVGFDVKCVRNQIITFTNIQYHKDMIVDYMINFRPK